MSTVTKRGALRDDLAQYDGVNETVTRIDSTGGTITGRPIGDEVDVLSVYGSGTSYSGATIAAAVSIIGSTNLRALRLSPGTWTVEQDVIIPDNIILIPAPGCIITVTSGNTLTLNSDPNVGHWQWLDPAMAGDIVLAFTGKVSVMWFGCKPNGTNASIGSQLAIDSIPVTPANEGGNTLVYPRGKWTLESPVVLGNAAYNIEGLGACTAIYTTGCTAFKQPNQSTTISIIRDMQFVGDSTADTSVFDSTPTVATQIIAKFHFERLRMRGYPRLFNVPNAQICIWKDCVFNMDEDGSCFYIHHSSTQQAFNSNRISGCQFTGVNAEAVDFVPFDTTTRAVQTIFRDCDFQQGNTKVPQLTINDDTWLVDGCEFENFSWSNAIFVTSANTSSIGNSTCIEHCIFAALAGTTNALDVAAAVNLGGGTVGIPVTGHPYTESGLTINIKNTDEYDGQYTIVSQTANQIVITATYVAENFTSASRIGIAAITIGGAHPTKPDIFASNNKFGASNFMFSFAVLNSRESLLLGNLGFTEKSLAGKVLEFGLGSNSILEVKEHGSTNLSGIDVDTLTVSGGIVKLNQTPDELSIAGGGTAASSLTTQQTDITSTGADNVTLADGAEGQEKDMFIAANSGGNITITPDNMHGGTSIAATTTGQTLGWKFTNSKWGLTKNPYNLTVT